ncbi:MAG: diacylglycerol/lipid kinase family protein [Porticoccaceae bacterium]
MSDLPSRAGGRIGILLNPNSGRVRRRLAVLRRLAADVPGADLHETRRPEDVASALRSMPAATTELLVVVGGDGTLQAVLTALLREASAQPPPLLVIPAGTTNMSAVDLGARRRPQAALRALARWRRGNGAEPTLTQRAVLRVDGIKGIDTEYAMFFGTGAIHSGVRYFQQRVRGAGVRGGLGPVLTFGRMLVALLRNRPHPLLPTSQVHIEGDAARWQGDWLLVLASTLDRLLLGSRPYWGAAPAPIHFTAVAHRPRRLWRTFAAIVRGRGAATAREPDGYVSRNLQTLSLTGIDDFVLDGECFKAASPLRISATAPLRFLAF